MCGAVARDGMARLIGILPNNEQAKFKTAVKTQKRIATGLSSTQRNPTNALTADALIILEVVAVHWLNSFALAARKPAFFVGFVMGSPKYQH